jgi:hypothetical protein
MKRDAETVWYDAEGHQLRERPRDCHHCGRLTFNTRLLCDDCLVREATEDMRSGGF